MDLSQYFNEENQALLVSYATSLAGALLVIIIGFWIANKLANIAGNQLEKSSNDKTLANFLRSIVGIGLKVMVIIAAAGMVGIATTSFVAVLGALAFAIGLALQGTLGHFASGVLLLFFRPYKVGDLVDVGGGQVGSVEALSIFNTILKTLDNKKIIVPNGTVTSNVITNISGQGVIGVELTFGIGYGDDIDKAREIILQVGKECPYILDEPSQGVVVASLGDSSVNLATRPFAKSVDYWDAFFYMNEHVKKAFDKGGINIPFPQMDVHMIKE